MNRIGQILHDKGLKQKWLSEKLGMTTVMINLYIKNKRQPKLDTMVKISRILNVDINELILRDSNFDKSNT
jgi:putative transcriptional regulator